MSSPIGWGWPILAAAATIVAAAARSVPALATAAAVVAVLAAAMTLVRVLERAPPAAARGLPPAATHPVGVREMFAAGPLGREDVILTLDWLERRGPHPNLRARTTAEIAMLVEANPDEFREYVRNRLETIEGSL